MFEVFTVVMENVRLWEIALLIFLFWLFHHPELVKSIQSIKVGELEIKLHELEAEVSRSRSEIEELEDELESSRLMFGDLLENVDVNAAGDLTPLAGLLKAHARALDDLDAVVELLQSGSSPEEVYAAAVTLRERRPVAQFSSLIDYLARIVDDDELGGNRLKTVWMLASATHKLLLAAVRDGIGPGIERSELQRAQSVLQRLERHPRVQADRPDRPDKGIRGPIRHAMAWIDRGLTGGA